VYINPEEVRVSKTGEQFEGIQDEVAIKAAAEKDSMWY